MKMLSAIALALISFAVVTGSSSKAKADDSYVRVHECSKGGWDRCSVNWDAGPYDGVAIMISDADSNGNPTGQPKLWACGKTGSKSDSWLSDGNHRLMKMYINTECSRWGGVWSYNGNSPAVYTVLLKAH